MADTASAGTIEVVHPQTQLLVDHLDHLAAQSRQVAASASGLAEAITAERYLRSLSALRDILSRHADTDEPLSYADVRAIAYAAGFEDPDGADLLDNPAYDPKA